MEFRRRNKTQVYSTRNTVPTRKLSKNKNENALLQKRKEFYINLYISIQNPTRKINTLLSLVLILTILKTNKLLTPIKQFTKLFLVATLKLS